MTAVPAEISGMQGAAPRNPDVPEPGQLVRIRGQQWVVGGGVDNSRQPQDELAATRLPGRTLVTLTSVSDDDLGDELTVAWEIEPRPCGLALAARSSLRRSRPSTGALTAWLPSAGPGCVPSGPDSAWHRQCLSCHEVAAAQLALAVDRPDGVPIQIGRCLLCGTTRSCRPGWTTRCMICLDDRTVEADADGHLRRAGDLMADTALTGRVRQALGLAEDAAVPYRVAREAASALVVAGRLRLMERPGWEVLATDVHGLPWYDSGQPCSHGTWGRHEKCGTIAKMTEGSLDCPSCGPEPGSRTHQARRDDPYLLYLVQTRKYQKFGVGDRRRVRSHIRGGAEVVQVLSGPFARVILAEKALKDLHRDAIVRSVRRGMIESFGQGTEVVRRHRRSRISLTAVMPDGEDVTHRFRALCAGSSTARTPSRASVTDLDDWLKTQAGQQERANNTRTFLAVEGLKVIGYYATTTYRLGLDEAAAMYGVRAAGISDPGAAAGAARGRRRLPGQRRRLEAAAPCAEGDCGGFPACRVRGRGGPRDRKRRRDVLRAAGLHPV